MIYIEKNTIGKFALELSQTLPTCTSCSYLFQFTWNETPENRTRYFTTPDISPALDRYNLFVISESLSGSTGSIVDNSPIQLDPGQYDYLVYWTTGSIDINDITPILNSTPISNGRMVVYTSSINSVYNQVINTQKPSVYD